MIKATWDAILAGLAAIKAGAPLIPLEWLDQWHAHLGVPPLTSLSLCHGASPLLFTELAIADLASIRAVLGVRRRQARIVADTLRDCFERLFHDDITVPIRRGMVAGTDEIACVTPAEDGCVIPPYGCVLYQPSETGWGVVRMWDDSDERKTFDRKCGHTRECQAST